MVYGGSRLYLLERRSVAHAPPAAAVLADDAGAIIGKFASGIGPSGILAGDSGPFGHPDVCRRPRACVPAHEARNAVLPAVVPRRYSRSCDSHARRPNPEDSRVGLWVAWAGAGFRHEDQQRLILRVRRRLRRALQQACRLAHAGGPGPRSPVQRSAERRPFHGAILYRSLFQLRQKYRPEINAEKALLATDGHRR